MDCAPWAVSWSSLETYFVPGRALIGCTRWGQPTALIVVPSSFCVKTNAICAWLNFDLFIAHAST